MRALSTRRMTRYRLPVLAAVAALTLGCAGGEPETASQAAPPGPTAAAAVVPVTAADLHERVRTAPGSVVLVNVWATWCAPCREEMPDLVRLQRDLGEDGFQLFLVSADFDLEDDDIQGALTSEGVDFESYFKDENDMVFIEAMHPEWSGALPASFLYDDAGNLVQFWQGKATYQEFREAIQSVLEPSTHSVSQDNGGTES